MTEERAVGRLSLSLAANRLPYDRSAVSPGIVHLGVGAFFRAHIAVYVDDILATDPSWGITGVSLRRPDTREALAPQDFLYTVAVRSGSGVETRIIGSLLDVLDATTQRDEILAAMADPQIRIVSLTVTEKGYCHDPATGALDAAHPDIVHDIAHPDAPVSAPGLIVRALELRRMAGTAPFTVLCCDNLPSNGQTAARVVTGVAQLRNADLADYVRREVAFPSTMVDRIVPATTDRDRELVLEATGLRDAWPVIAEPFTQWVIEDRFTAGRPPFENAGAELVNDVRAHELTKLRMLNGSHSMLAYLGYLAGYQHVDEAIADDALRTLISGFMSEEVMPMLSGDAVDRGAYRDALIARFSNPALKHRTWQIAMDGSQKLPQRLLGTIRDRIARGLPVTRGALGVAAWMRYVTGIDELGGPIDVKDPMAGQLRAIADAAGGSPEKLVRGLLGVAEIFGDDLPQSPVFVSVLTQHLVSLFENGALRTADSVNQRARG
ncbi:MAG: mannitol dehydrogenase family protein [Rhizobiaceae bacterium]